SATRYRRSRRFIGRPIDTSYRTDSIHRFEKWEAEPYSCLRQRGTPRSRGPAQPPNRPIPSLQTRSDIMLTVGDKFPEFKLKATVAIDSLDTAFKDIDNTTHKGKWTLVFFYPKDFTFVCPTEIKGFGDLNQQFADRDHQGLGARTDSDLRPPPWGKDPKDLRDLPFPMLADTAKRLS